MVHSLYITRCQIGSQCKSSRSYSTVSCHVYRESKTGVTRGLVVINVYCPRAERGNAERLEYKLRFYRLLQLRAEAILESGR